MFLHISSFHLSNPNKQSNGQMTSKGNEEGSSCII